MASLPQEAIACNDGEPFAAHNQIVHRGRKLEGIVSINRASMVAHDSVRR